MPRMDYSTLQMRQRIEFHRTECLAGAKAFHFEDWFEGTREAFELRCVTDAAFRARVEAADAVRKAALPTHKYG